MRYKSEIEVSTEINLRFETPLFTGDIGNTVGLEFYLRGQPYSAQSAQIYTRRPDGEVASLSVVMNGNVLEFTIPNNMYPEKGEMETQIALLDENGNILTSGVLHFDVLEGLSGQADIVGTDQYNDMTALLSQIAEGIDQIDRAQGLSDEMEAFLEEYGDVGNQVIANLTETELASFVKGVGLVTSSETQDSESGPIYTEYTWPVAAEYSDTFGSAAVTQVRFHKGNLEKRTGSGSASALTWTDWTSLIDDTPEPAAYDLIIDQDTDLSAYAGQTISEKTVFFKASKSVESAINITFSNCVIYGNSKSIGTMGLTKFTSCTLYSLNVNPPVVYGDETNDYTTTAGSCSFDYCTIYDGYIFSYWDPNLSNCIVENCSLSGYGHSVYTKNSTFIGCNFNYCGPNAMEGNQYNIFTDCSNFGGWTSLTGQCYFGGCGGNVMVSSSATLKPSTSTAFADQNFASLTIG